MYRTLVCRKCKRQNRSDRRLFTAASNRTYVFRRLFFFFYSFYKTVVLNGNKQRNNNDNNNNPNCPNTSYLKTENDIFRMSTTFARSFGMFSGRCNTAGLLRGGRARDNYSDDAALSSYFVLGTYAKRYNIPKS